MRLGTLGFFCLLRKKARLTAMHTYSHLCYLMQKPWPNAPTLRRWEMKILGLNVLDHLTTQTKIPRLEAARFLCQTIETWEHNASACCSNGKRNTWGMEALECFFCGEGHQATIMSLKTKNGVCICNNFFNNEKHETRIDQKKNLKEGGSLPLGCCGLRLEIAPLLK